MARPISLTTPLGRDVLLVTGLTGQESLSSLFSFQLDLVAPKAQKVPFDSLVGRPMTIQLRSGEGPGRFFSGVCSRFSQGARGPALTAYHAEVVPWLWFLTQTSDSRSFGALSVPEIVEKVVQGGDVSFELQGVHEKRDYCVQYRESDFDFASRLMEEEGIFYFFKHTSTGHRLAVADSSASHPDLGKATFKTGAGPEPRVFGWTKTQELRSGKVTLWDHAFELPHNHLQGQSPIPAAVEVGSVKHQLLLAANQGLETYDFPGGYAKRFNGVGPTGGSQSGELAKILPVAQRTAAFRAQEEAIASIGITGASLCRNFTAGYRFALAGHFNGDGRYMLTSVTHRARVIGDVRTAGPKDLEYGNTFTCIPEALQFRPPRVTPRPVVEGTQTAYVVGPAGEQVFADKYGRVKVQFHWDREGQSSTWVRVGALHEGLESGFITVPRIGHEVIVAFLEGDPDQPIIVGSLYNAERMPPP